MLFAFSNVVMTKFLTIWHIGSCLLLEHSYQNGKKKRFNSQLKNHLKSVGPADRGANLTWMLSILYFKFSHRCIDRLKLNI